MTQCFVLKCGFASCK